MEVPMAESDPADLYEFDAPSHVVDFKAPDQEMSVDDWFEKRGDGVCDQLATPVRHVVAEEADEACLESASPPSGVIGDQKSTQNVTNIVTSWGTKGPARVVAQPKKGPSAQPRRVSKRKESAGNEGAAAAPAAKKQRSSTSRPTQPIRRSVRQDVRAATKARAAAANNSTQSKQKSSEQQEMERIKNLQNEVAEQRKKNEASYKAALAGVPPQRKMQLSTTVAKEFNFSTDGRIKTAPTESSYKEVNFTAQLRRHPSSPLKAPRGATVPKPFNLSTSNKNKEAGPSPYVSMAQQIEQFQKRTPDRYHLRSRQSQERGPSPLKKNQPLRITEAHTPQLMTRQRSRPTALKSSAELEAEEAQKLQQYKFKALELDRKILEGALNPKKPAVKEPTKPEGFQLQMEKRIQERHANKKPEEPEELPSFHAVPVPTKILEHVVGVPEKKVHHPTVPESPAFALKNRVRVEKKVEEVKAPAPIKAMAAPHFALPFLPKLEKNNVETCPFSFEERERERRAMKEKRLEELRNEEVPKFKAQLLPDFHEVVLPEKKVMEPTKIEPFKLLIDERGAVKQDRWEQMMKDDQKRQAEAASFKARPNLVTHKEPFVVKKENRSILEHSNSSTVPEGFQLSTERRAKERQEYDRIQCEEAARRARLEEEQRREQEEREKENVIRLRQEQVHKAQPIRRYKPVEVKKSDIALTVPLTPNFSDRHRK